MSQTRVCVVMDGPGRVEWAVARALKLAGCYEVHAILPGKDRFDAVRGWLASNSVQTYHRIKRLAPTQEFAEEVARLAAKHRFDLVFPASHCGTVALAKAKPWLDGRCRVAVEDYEKLMEFHDKGRTMLLAEELDIPHPRTLFPKDVEEVSSCARELAYPVVVKARKGTAATAVWYARSPEELIGLYRRVAEEGREDDGVFYDASAPIVQEYIPGELHDAVAFSVNGEVRCGLTQTRRVSKPLHGGMGVVDVTTRDPQLLEYARRLLARTGWTGGVMVDFRLDPRDGVPKLLEVNPRFWGGTWLTVCAGMNIPHYLVQTALGNPVSIPTEYPAGLMCRWPFLEFETIFERPCTLRNAASRLRAFLARFRYKPCVYDVVGWDLKPAAADLLGVAREAVKGLKRRVMRS
jgi:predicted ATP-grasp superfamily ATP-dependent carboligase